MAPAGARRYLCPMADNPYLAHLKREREQCESMLASLESADLLSGVSPEYHNARIQFLRRQVRDLTEAIYTEEALF